MKIFILVAFALGVVAGTVDDCHFDPQHACNHCPWDRNYVYFVANSCNCTIFYLCEKRSDGVIIPHEQHCNPCFCFSNDVWTCSIRIASDPCPSAPPPATDPAPPVIPYRNFFCVDFDNDYRDKRVYYDVAPSCIISNVSELYPQYDIFHTGLKMEKKALLTGGYPCSIEIPYFKNNQFTQFTFCGLLVFYEVPGQELGLLYNGYVDECYPGSIKLLLTQDRRVQGEVHTVGGVYQITSGQTVSAYEPHKVCFRYDGSKQVKSLELVIDGLPEKQSFDNPASGLTIPQKCNMRLGEVLERALWMFGNYYYRQSFVGILDTWCFSPSIVDESYFISP